MAGRRGPVEARSFLSCGSASPCEYDGEVTSRLGWLGHYHRFGLRAWHLRSYARAPAFKLSPEPRSDSWVRTIQVTPLRDVLDHVKKFVLASGTRNGPCKPFDQFVASLPNRACGYHARSHVIVRTVPVERALRRPCLSLQDNPRNSRHRDRREPVCHREVRGMSGRGRL